MDLAEFQTLAARTAPTDLSGEDMHENCAMGLVGEFGELVDLLKKRKFHGHDKLHDKLRDEFGDVLWYAATSATVMGIELVCAEFHDLDDPYAVAVTVALFARRLAYGGGSAAHLAQVVAGIAEMINAADMTLDEVLTRNVEKLRERYPDGFSTESSIERVDTAFDSMAEPPIRARTATVYDDESKALAMIVYTDHEPHGELLRMVEGCYAKSFVIEHSYRDTGEVFKTIQMSRECGVWTVLRIDVTGAGNVGLEL